MADAPILGPTSRDEHLHFDPVTGGYRCRDCDQPLEPKLHAGSGLMQWRCTNDGCWLSK